ncbi:MAG: hypothetical protein J3R72DRAFT_69794 [Linnemannia gamsii]|nr:MAG: hypothetical protein J3R72DRAFT_69794 [Linnemannia gamsii]
MTILTSLSNDPRQLRKETVRKMESSSKRHRSHSLMDAIELAGFTEKAMVDGESDLSCLDNKERVVLLGFIGQNVDRTDTFRSLSSAALALQGTGFSDVDKLSAPHGRVFPIVNTKDLYVRKAYKELYKTILETFEDRRNEVQKQVVVTGTSGIGKSAFLVYFTIRLLAESNDDDPPIIIFHTKGGSECFVFGGRSTVRSGDIDTFKPFLNLSDTWYFADSSPSPALKGAKTVISVSPKTLFSEAQQYQDIDKEVEWRYYMAPWSLEELKMCWARVEGFQVVPLDMAEELYSMIGGVPRYVLEKPMKVLNRLHNDRFNDHRRAKDEACERLVQALDKVKDPVMLMQCFSHGKDSLEFSSRLIHRWPTDDHSSFRLEWASTYVTEKVAALLSQDACDRMLDRLIREPNGSASGIMFEAYILRAFREGGHAFEIKNLETGGLASLEIPRNPKTEHFDKITSVPAGTLCIPKICNYACVDLLLAPRDLFQITVSDNHPIKGAPLSNLLKSLTQAGWDSSKELRLIFVVPGRVYADFKKQNYLTSEGTAYKTIPADIQRVTQYVLKIDLESAASGKSLGLPALP